ncbi:MAG TPA: lysophospholipid acyltransferase family protein [Fimbriimonadaceae bacterium]|nr:hypothetical protein [Armatimonadota bacterium]HCM73620.1 hypothetical protein [Armatimonadota bacterium]HRD31973.1 lysophospholipid acyltransferase family protein [Fimbriimonadaceae bacterium]HRE92648.1 lysophospholipid acyltransferase family protein [Fimbriimonadaceae bacterium]HRI73609.1 lysophospholipid acyltransferase family protein [Fimbriimonadaceae bacterium]
MSQSRLKSWWRGVRPRVLAFPIYCIVRLLLATVRIEVVGREKCTGGPYLLAGWHGRTMLATKVFRGDGIWTIISLSNDGNMQTRIFQRFGFRVIRGSTGRGGARALAESIKVLRQGGWMAFTPDGPRGPSQVVQPGIVRMSQKAQAPMVPMGVSANRRWLINSWDRYMVPKPFSRAVMIFGDAVTVPADADEETLEAARLQLEAEIKRVEAEAEARMGHAH